jgi:hypothetical protein
VDRTFFLSEEEEVVKKDPEISTERVIKPASCSAGGETKALGRRRPWHSPRMSYQKC